MKDSFVFDEECFMESSFRCCTHLRLLSAQASLGSTIWYGQQVDRYCPDSTNGDYNVKIMLKNMGFMGIKSNAYYNMEGLQDSIGVA